MAFLISLIFYLWVNFKLYTMKKHLLFIFAGLLSSAVAKAQCTADFTYTVSAAGTVSVSATGTAGTPSGYAWQWGDGTTIPGSGQNASHTYTASGTYSLCLTYGVLIPPASPCTTQVCKNVVVTVVGVREYTNFLQNISISPNPSKSFVNIEYSLTQSSKLNISILDVTGKLIDNIDSEKELEAGKHNFRHNVENLSSGIYFIRFKAENGVETKKLIID